MSEIMLHGVLNMPPELWNNDSPIDVMQRHSRYVQASKYIDELETELTAVTKQLDKLAEAIRKHKDTLHFTPHLCDIELYYALQSINQPTP